MAVQMLYRGSGCLGKHPLISGCLGFQEVVKCLLSDFCCFLFWLRSLLLLVAFFLVSVYNLYLLDFVCRSPKCSNSRQTSTSDKTNTTWTMFFSQTISEKKRWTRRQRCVNISFVAVSDPMLLWSLQCWASPVRDLHASYSTFSSLKKRRSAIGPPTSPCKNIGWACCTCSFIVTSGCPLLLVVSFAPSRKARSP